MIKSLAITSIVCALNMGGSFNIHPQQATWDQTQEINKQNSSYQTLQQVEKANNVELYTIKIWNKNSYVYENSYIRIDTTIVNYYHFQIENNENVINIGNLQCVTYIWTNYKAFSINADLFNVYPSYEIANGFSDQYGTEYTWSYIEPENARETPYTPTQESKTAVNTIKNETNGNNIGADITNVTNEINSITNVNYNDDTRISVNGNILTYSYNAFEQNETPERATYTIIHESGIPLDIASNGTVITSNDEKLAWFNRFYQVLNGVNTWVYTANSSSFVKNRTSYYMVVDTGSATSPEVIDIGGIMWDIIGMPFTFINQAFDVTLFPGTIYQFNIGNLFKGLIAILAILFVVKLFTRGIDVLGAYTGNLQDNRFKRENQQMKREKHQMEKESHAKEMAKTTNKKE